MKTTILAAALTAATALTPIGAMAETLAFGTGNVPMHPINKRIMEPWAEAVNAEGDAVDIQVRHGPAILNHQNFIDRVTDDVVQIGYGVLVFDPGRFPRSLVSTTPFIQGSAQAGAMAFCELYEAGAFGDEFADYQPLLFIPFPQRKIHLNGSEITSFSDMKGKKIAVGSPVASAIVSANGGTPLSTALPDQYQALQRGTADGTFMTYTAFPGFKLNEVTTDHLEAPLGGATAMVFMAKDRYDALSDAAKAQLDAHSGCAKSREVGAEVDQWEIDSKMFVMNNGDHTFNEISDAEFNALRDNVFPNIVAGFAERVPGGAELIEQWDAAVTKAQDEIDGGS